MNLQSLTFEYITQHSKEKLLKELNTSNSKILDKFLTCKNIAEFLDKGYFDYKYSSSEFVKALSCLLNYANLNEEINLSRKFNNKEKEQNKRVYGVRVSALFGRGAKGFFSAMSYNSFSNVKLDKETLLNKTDDEIIELLKPKAKEHYLKTKGNESAKEKFGNIVLYVLK